MLHRVFCVASLMIVPVVASVDLMDVGALLFAEHCSGCHGADGTEGDSGNIRNLTPATVQRAMRGIEEMPAFELEADEARAIVAWVSGVAAP